MVTWMLLVACSSSPSEPGPSEPVVPTSETADPEAPTTSTPETGSPSDTAPPVPPRVLLFTKTEGFRHGSIAQAVPALQAEGAKRGWTVTHTEDAGTFTPASLADFDVIVFLLTTGDVLDADQQAAMEGFVAAGGGFAGVHSATDTEYDWPWYGELVGAYFSGHPRVQSADVLVDDARHPATAHLTTPWNRDDEWYAFRDNPRARVDVLLSLDESSYDPGNHAMDGDHPIAWSQTIHGGRSFYTAGGHTSASYGEADFLRHLAEGIAWAAGS
ncbi:MAG: ThuA domain-containing protein [Myxococcota bacterium]